MASQKDVPDGAREGFIGEACYQIITLIIINLIGIFTHLKLCLADAIHNFK